MTAQAPARPLTVLLVDDEALARARLRTLVGDCTAPVAEVVGEAADATHAIDWLASHSADVVLLDIHMPGMDGLALARALQRHPPAPALVFVTAHAEHAVAAFEVEALDYLTKPVWLERLQQTLQKAERYRKDSLGPEANLVQKSLLIQSLGRTERIPLADVLFLKAELKYITVQTARRSHIMDGTLSELEARHGDFFLRVHRNALVARHAMRALEKHADAEDGEGWALRLHGTEALLAVSRRQLAAVREALSRPVD